MSVHHPQGAVPAQHPLLFEEELQKRLLLLLSPRQSVTFAELFTAVSQSFPDPFALGVNLLLLVRNERCTTQQKVAAVFIVYALFAYNRRNPNALFESHPFCLFLIEMIQDPEVAPMAASFFDPRLTIERVYHMTFDVYIRNIHIPSVSQDHYQNLRRAYFMRRDRDSQSLAGISPLLEASDPIVNVLDVYAPSPDLSLEILSQELRPPWASIPIGASPGSNQPEHLTFPLIAMRMYWMGPSVLDMVKDASSSQLSPADTIECVDYINDCSLDVFKKLSFTKAELGSMVQLNPKLVACLGAKDNGEIRTMLNSVLPSQPATTHTLDAIRHYAALLDQRGESLPPELQGFVSAK